MPGAVVPGRFNHREGVAEAVLDVPLPEDPVVAEEPGAGDSCRDIATERSGA